MFLLQIVSVNVSLFARSEKSAKVSKSKRLVLSGCAVRIMSVYSQPLKS